MRIIESLINSLKNEKNIEKTLPFNSIADKMIPIIKKQIDYKNKLGKFKVIQSIIDQEIESCKYFIHSYVSTRLRKIENLGFDPKFLTSRELLYKFKSNSNFYMKSNVVIFRAVENLGNIVIDDNSIDVKKGDVFVTDIDDVFYLLLENKIVLI
ncbi:hypothetical protein DMUE_3183 [Dictyocoela muelleri]|nr:hypothetical protein DMUE_3183 [Dictyocoela muelleri]